MLSEKQSDDDIRSGQTTMTSFIEQHQLKMTIKPTDKNVNMAHSRDMNHWRVYLRSGETGERMSVTFSQGRGIKHDPRLGDVLNCLISDAASIEGSDIVEFALEYGYTNEREAAKVYAKIERQAVRLRNLLGEEAYGQLMYEVYLD